MLFVSSQWYFALYKIVSGNWMTLDNGLTRVWTIIPVMLHGIPPWYASIRIPFSALLWSRRTTFYREFWPCRACSLSKAIRIRSVFARPTGKICNMACSLRSMVQQTSHSLFPNHRAHRDWHSTSIPLRKKWTQNEIEIMFTSQQHIRCGCVQCRNVVHGWLAITFFNWHFYESCRSIFRCTKRFQQLFVCWKIRKREKQRGVRWMNGEQKRWTTILMKDVWIRNDRFESSNDIYWIPCTRVWRCAIRVYFNLWSAFLWRYDFLVIYVIGSAHHTSLHIVDQRAARENKTKQIKIVFKTRW